MIRCLGFVLELYEGRGVSGIKLKKFIIAEMDNGNMEIILFLVSAYV